MARIRARVDSDHAFIVWDMDAPIPGCRGFSLRRKLTASGVETVLDTSVGFADAAVSPGTTRPSTQWPIQRFMWLDDNPPREEISYQAVPLVGDKDALAEDAAHATGWSRPVTVSADAGDGISAYFNRGVVATQWLSRALRDRGGVTRAVLTTIVNTPGDQIRNFLGGSVLWRLPQLLQEALQSGGEIHAALFELNDPQLIAGLEALGSRAHVLLGNGASDDDENQQARNALRKAHVDVRDRLVSTSSHFAHNKFLVVSGADGPRAVWTGSTNWTTTGLCTQSNNAILIENAEVAGWYRSEWDQLVSAGNDYPDDLLVSHEVVRQTGLGQAVSAQVWFAPVRRTIDLESARQRINEAAQGILFLMFNPGPVGTLLNDIVERTTPGSATYDPQLHIRGVVNQDPSTTAHPVVGLLDRGELTEADIDVVLPSAVGDDYGYWLRELSYSMVRVSSRCIVIDPFGPKPCIMTGSHSMGPKASSRNDDNLVIIDGERKLAEAYAVHIMGLYDHYRWRHYQRRESQGQSVVISTATGAGPTWAGLVNDDTWQNRYFSPGPEQRELAFWLPAAAETFSDDLAGDLSADLVKADEGIPPEYDYLGMSTYVGMFASIIAYKKTPLPLSIGLFGEWGSGKSYFMGLLRDRVQRLAGSASPDYCHDIVQIGFNAWSYADSNLWASLGDEIFRQLAGPAATGDRKRPDALNKELQQTLERATELKAAKKKAEDEAANLHADLAAARNEYSNSLTALVKATVQTSASSVLGEAWSRLGVTNEAEQVEILLNETKGARADAVALRRVVARRRFFFLGILAVVGVGLLLAPLWAGAARALLSTAGATALLASVVVVTTTLRRVRSALQTVSAEATRINDRIEQNADEKFAEEVDAVRQANARRQVIQAQLGEVLSRAGELGRELVDINPGQRLYGFLSERAASGDYSGQLGLISTIRKDFQRLIELMDEWRKHPDDEARRPIDRIVLYIDDLDRCSTEQVAAVLQAVHLLLALDLFVVVVGVDPRWLLHSLRQQYRRILAAEPENFESDEEQLWTSTPGDYLEKIFNIPFVLPAMTPDTFKSLIESLATPAAGAGQAGSDSESGTPVGSPMVDVGPSDATREESSDTETGTEHPPAAPVTQQTATLLQAEEGSEVAAHEAAARDAEGNGVALKPRPLTEDELQLIYALAPMVGTPRGAKRLFNLYRMLRSTRNLSDASRFLGSAGEPGQYQATAVLLGLLTAYPRLLGQMLWAAPDEEQQLSGGLCERAPDSMTWVQFLDSLEPEERNGRWRNAVNSQLSDAGRDQWSRLVSAARLSAELVQLPDLSAFRYWADHVARFSFLLSTMGATPDLGQPDDQA